MKIPCKVFIQDRTLVNFSMKSRKTPLKSTLALCKHGKENQDFVLIHFSTQNKTGTKYKVKDNVQTILTKFINEGKATIQFKQPAHDFYITGDTKDLKCFLQLVKLALEKKISPKDLKISSMTVQPLTEKDIPVEKLIITKRSEIPIRGFPKELKRLSINDINLCSLPKGVLNLKALRTLDLSGNSIEYLPREFCKLQLQSLDLEGNNLYKSTIRQWDWISETLCENLCWINLSSNNLRYIPEQILRLRCMRELRLNNNNVKTIPYGIRTLRDLKKLYVAKNKLTCLPYSIFWMALDELDISNNEFPLPTNKCNTNSASASVRSLVELAAQIVHRSKLPYNAETIPFTLVNYLDNPYYCICGKVCFQEYVTDSLLLRLPADLAHTVVFSPDAEVAVMDVNYCSIKCKLLYRIT